MSAERCILRIQYTSVGRGVGKQVAGFVKYIQHRDQHQNDPRVAGIVKYIGHRDQAAERGDMFGASGPVGKRERKQLVAFVAESFKASKPQLYRDREGKLLDSRRAVHRLILSPEFAEGLDLKRVTRVALAQLEQDSGGLGPWIAAEHRNTKHPHVHVVIAGRREVAPGKYRSVVITRKRLELMKQAMHREIGRQRQLTPVAQRTAELLRWAETRGSRRHWRHLATRRVSRHSLAPVATEVARGLRRLSWQYAREAEREALLRSQGREWAR